MNDPVTSITAHKLIHVTTKPVVSLEMTSVDGLGECHGLASVHKMTTNLEQAHQILATMEEVRVVLEQAKQQIMPK